MMHPNLAPPQTCAWCLLNASRRVEVRRRVSPVDWWMLRVWLSTGQRWSLTEWEVRIAAVLPYAGPPDAVQRNRIMRILGHVSPGGRMPGEPRVLANL